MSDFRITVLKPGDPVPANARFLYAATETQTEIVQMTRVGNFVPKTYSITRLYYEIPE